MLETKVSKANTSRLRRLIGATVIGAATLLGGALYATPANAAEAAKDTKPAVSHYVIPRVCAQVNNAEGKPVREYSFVKPGSSLSMTEDESLKLCDEYELRAVDQNGIGPDLKLDALINDSEGNPVEDKTPNPNKSKRAFDFPINPRADGLEPGKYTLHFHGEQGRASKADVETELTILPGEKPAAPACSTDPEVIVDSAPCPSEKITEFKAYPVPYPVPVPVPGKAAVFLDYKRDGFVHEGSLTVLKVGEKWSYGFGVAAGVGHKDIDRRFQGDLGVDTGRQVLDLESFYGSGVDVIRGDAIFQLMRRVNGRVHVGGRLGVGGMQLSAANKTYQTARDHVTYEQVKYQECDNGVYKVNGLHGLVDGVLEVEAVKDKISVVVNGGVGYNGANEIIHEADNQRVKAMPRVTKRFGVGVKWRF
ncbi:hypothetical protein JW711_05590 [Candidatus Woesearchaeota archaeon]|nr:hypothetical protein [Candidatus Woesearchaeota archaeon]